MTKRQMAEQLADRPGAQAFGLVPREQVIKDYMRFSKAQLETKLEQPVRLPNARALSY
jgi:hypothetical protein